MKRQYYSMEKVGSEASISIYGDISSWAGWEGENVTAKSLAKSLEELTDVSRINVYINSYGGEVAEGLAIYNALKRHKAKVVTYCDGFAASIASVIFMAGGERIMNDSSLLMIHNAWSWGEGNAEQLRKQADDLDKITQASVVAYKAHSNLSEEEIKELMDKESWILPEEALEYGFATSIEKTEKKAASQNAKKLVLEIVKKYKQEADDGADDEDEDDPEAEAPKNAADGDEDEGGEEPEDEDEKPADEENEADNPEDEPPEDETDEEEKKAAEKLSGFFKAIMKM